MEKLFTYYFQRADFANALRIAEGQCLEFPYTITYFERAAKLAQKLNDDSRALFYLIKIWNNFVKSNEIAEQLVITTLNADRPELANQYFDYLILNTNPNRHLVEMRNTVFEIIRKKKQLEDNPEDISVINEIADLYIQVNNEKAA